jgi:two-component system sensor histidine kinase SenX3
VDATTQAFLAALIGALVAGGGVLAWHVSERQQRTLPVMDEPAVPAGVASVLSVLRSSAVVVGADDTVREGERAGVRDGLVSGTSLMSTELAELVAEVRRDGQIRETELLMARHHATPRHVTVRIAPLSSTLVLALVEDRTRERRVERSAATSWPTCPTSSRPRRRDPAPLRGRRRRGPNDPEAVRRFAGRMLTESERLSRWCSRSSSCRGSRTTTRSTRR